MKTLAVLQKMSEVVLNQNQNLTLNTIADILFPESDIILCITEIDALSEIIYPEEFDIVKSSSAKRIKEFSAGRICAKHALLAFNITGQPILSGQMREPVWPEGIVGSISHCHDLAAAVLARNKTCNAIGIDVEKAKKLKYNFSRYVCTETEKKWLAKQDHSKYDLLLTLIFSCKESVYKAFYHLTHTRLGFKDCTVIPDLNLNLANVVLSNKKDAVEFSQAIIQRFYISDTHIYSSTLIK